MCRVPLVSSTQGLADLLAQDLDDFVPPRSLAIFRLDAGPRERRESVLVPVMRLFLASFRRHARPASSRVGPFPTPSMPSQGVSSYSLTGSLSPVSLISRCLSLADLCEFGSRISMPAGSTGASVRWARTIESMRRVLPWLLFLAPPLLSAQSIEFQADRKIWLLKTQASSYALGVTPDGCRTLVFKCLPNVMHA